MPNFFSFAETQELLRLPKQLNEKMAVFHLAKDRHRLLMNSPEQNEYLFLVDIAYSKKVNFKISIHHQEHRNQIGLVRLDYRGRHTNPVSIRVDTPSFLIPHAGREFGIGEAHIHIQIEGYKDLAWALPLDAHDFPVNMVNSDGDYIDALNAFWDMIHLQDRFSYQTGIV